MMKYTVTGPGLDLQVEVLEAPGGRYRVRVLGKEYDVGWSPALGATHWWLDWGGGPQDAGRQVLIVEPEGNDLGVTLDIDHLDLRVLPARLVARRRTRTEAQQDVEIRAPMPGLVVSVEVQPGQAVAASATVAVIEAMKMQMELRTPAAGIVREVRVQGGREVSAGDVIAVLVPHRGGEDTV